MFEQGDALASAELQTSYLSVVDYLVCVTKIVIWTLLEEPTCHFAKSPPLHIGRRMLFQHPCAIGHKHVSLPSSTRHLQNLVRLTDYFKSTYTYASVA
jgi:hypothetical protein